MVIKSNCRRVSRRSFLKGAGILGAGLTLGTTKFPGLTLRRALAAQPQFVPIGSLAPLTGSQASYGTFIQQGQMLFEELFNKAGGYQSGPEKGKLLKMIYEDDGEGTGTPDTVISAFRKLVHVDGVKAVSGIILSSVALPLAPIAQESNCVVIAIDPTTPRLSTFPHFFRITESSDTAAPVYAACVIKAGFKNVNFMWINDPAGAGFHEKFGPELQKGGGRIVLDLPIAAGGTDFKSEITKCMATTADCNVLLTHQGETLIILKQAYDLGYVHPKTQWFCNYYSEEMLQKGGVTFENTYAKQYHVPKETQEYQRFEQNFKAKYGAQNPIAYFSMASYDALTAITRAIETNGYNWDGMNAALHKMDFQGVSKRIRFNAQNGDNITTSQDISKVQNGKYVVLFHYDPSTGTVQTK
jgi:branched-chain amino acid transport system substrate-binding protein